MFAHGIDRDTSLLQLLATPLFDAPPLVLDLEIKEIPNRAYFLDCCYLD